MRNSLALNLGCTGKSPGEPPQTPRPGSPQTPAVRGPVAGPGQQASSSARLGLTVRSCVPEGLSSAARA